MQVQRSRIFIARRAAQGEVRVVARHRAPLDRDYLVGESQFDRAIALQRNMCNLYRELLNAEAAAQQFRLFERPGKFRVTIQRRVVRNFAAHPLRQKRIDVEVTEFQRRIARHVAFHVETSVEGQAGMGKIRPRRQSKLASVSQRLGRQAANVLTIQHQLGNLYVSVDHRFRRSVPEPFTVKSVSPATCRRGRWIAGISARSMLCPMRSSFMPSLRKSYDADPTTDPRAACR